MRRAEGEGDDTAGRFVALLTGVVAARCALSSSGLAHPDVRLRLERALAHAGQGVPCPGPIAPKLPWPPRSGRRSVNQKDSQPCRLSPDCVVHCWLFAITIEIERGSLTAP